MSSVDKFSLVYCTDATWQEIRITYISRFLDAKKLNSFQEPTIKVYISKKYFKSCIYYLGCLIVLFFGMSSSWVFSCRQHFKLLEGFFFCYWVFIFFQYQGGKFWILSIVYIWTLYIERWQFGIIFCFTLFNNKFLLINFFCFNNLDFYFRVLIPFY